MTRKLSPLLAAIALLLCPIGARAAVAPPSFTGITPQGSTTAYDYSLMRTSGVKSVRLLMLWSEIQPENRYVSRPKWVNFDRQVELAAERGIRVFPFLLGTPSWVAGDSRQLPVQTPWQRWAWSAFLRDAAERYGPDGEFWRENPGLPYLPIRKWEIWNEENIVTFTRPVSPVQYGKLLRISGRVLHSIDGGAKVIVGGLFGHPLQVPPNLPSGAFLSELYRQRPIKKYFDGVALHPYVADAAAIRGQVHNLRRVMRVHHDGATDLYMTELGWGSASYQSRWERGLRGQARELNDAMAMLVANRRAWRIGGVWWFSWRDLKGNCQFCDSAGLLTEDREAKPSWYAFNAWTGGNPDTVPRLQFGD